ncbi:MAG: phage tail sheath family protein [Planctomycetota bacterium]
MLPPQLLRSLISSHVDQIFNMGDFQREFGGLHTNSEASYAIDQFFKNGGSEAWVVRTAEENTAQAAAIELQDSASSILLATAADEGTWGDNVRIDVDYATTDPDNTFNLAVTEFASTAGRLQPVSTETFRNLIIDDTASNHVIDVVNDGSKLIQLELVGTPTSGQRPAQTGTISNAITNTLVSGLTAGDTMVVSLNGVSFSTDPVTLATPLPTTPAALAVDLQTRIREVDSELERATVILLGSGVLQAKPGTNTSSDIISFSGALATALGLDNTSRTNVQQYALGSDVVAGSQALPAGSPQPGEDGNPPDATALIGNQASKTGIYALEDVDIFNILCIPSTMKLGDTEAAQVSAKAIEYCEDRRAFYILDVPHIDKTRDEVDEIKTWLDENATLRHKNAALYFPRPFIADPLNQFRLRPIGPSGTIAGLYARIDGERGVWKAPAGTEASLRGVQKLEYYLTDMENGTLNPLAINCLRNFDIYGNLSWGARTLDGADQQASEWKYIPVRRLALFLEESLFRGTKWVVFEPNDEPLWAQIRLNIGAFMHRLFRQGAFQGTTPQEAYLVKCDGETTTQADINLGIVNIVVGFAPLKPAEFVIIKIQQLAGQIQT